MGADPGFQTLVEALRGPTWRNVNGRLQEMSC